MYEATYRSIVMWSDCIEPSNLLFHLKRLWAGMSRHAQRELLHLKNQLNYRLGFSHLVTNPKRRYRFVQSFQLGVFKHTQPDQKQRVSDTSKMNLRINLIFCKWSGIYSYIYMIQSIHMGMIRQTLACQK